MKLKICIYVRFLLSVAYYKDFTSLSIAWSKPIRERQFRRALQKHQTSPFSTHMAYTLTKSSREETGFVKPQAYPNALGLS